MSLPARRILAVAEAAYLGPIQHLLDACADARRGLGLIAPHRLDHFHDERGVDIGHQ